YRLIDQLQEEVLILYQELKSLPPKEREAVLQKELEMVNLVKEAIVKSFPSTLDDAEATLLANTIFVQGHMWSFRRWTLQREYSLDEYVEKQIDFVLRILRIERTS